MGVIYTNAAKQKCWYIRSIHLIVVLLCLFVNTSTAQGNFSFSGYEAVSFGTLDLAACAGASWGTERLATPGYFSAANGASFSGGSDVYNVNGYVKKYGNEAFTFPVGSGSDLRALHISAPASVTDAYATAWIAGNPSADNDHTLPNAGAHSTLSFAAPIIAVSTQGQWDWQVGGAGNLGAGTTGNGAGLTITVSIPDMTSFAEAISLRLAGWDGTNWIDLSGSPTASGSSENSTLSGTMVPGITAIAIATVAPPQPFLLLSFDAELSRCEASLNWQTYAERTLDKFIVEQSIDNISFKAIETVTAKNTPDLNKYSTIVPQPQGITYYYRLKMVNINGSFTYSNTISYKSSCAAFGTIVVYPNPVIDQPVINIKITTVYRGKASLVFTNLLGQRLMSLPQEINSDRTIVPAGISWIAQGVYFITVFTSEGAQLGVTQKFIKTN